MTIETNHSLSADCVIIGFNGLELKVLLIENRESQDGTRRNKLPGAMILENETLPDAAKRILADMTGLKDIELKQTYIYSNPDRVGDSDLEWINRNHGVRSQRVVTVGYYALIKLNSATIKHTTKRGAYWCSIDDVGQLMMDHNKILSDTLNILKMETSQFPIAFNLLPKHFTLRAVQDLYGAILSVNIDKRNFRRKLLSSGLLTPTNKKEVGVAHKPATYYTFNYVEYNRLLRGGVKLRFY
ncbi:MAG: NUDIX hydrolase [Rikenellaceae bacterium]